MEKFRVVLLWIALCLVCISVTIVMQSLFGRTIGLILGYLISFSIGYRSQEIIYWIIRWLDGLVKK